MTVSQVKNTSIKPQGQKSSQKLTKAEVEAKLAEKFGKIPKKKAPKKPVEDQVDVNSKDMMLKSDIANNNPDASETREKLRQILKTGAFEFNSKERNALDKILN